MDDATNPAPPPLPGPAPEPPPEAPPEPAPEAAPTAHPRRWFLAAGGALVLGAGAGIGVAALRPADRRPAPRPETPPADLTAALDAAVLAEERALLADLDATTGGPGAVRQVIAQARADHTAHLQALRGVQRSLPKPKRRLPPRQLRGTPRTKAQLRSAETRAADAAAQRAATLDGATSALLASIAACEATHAELFR